MLWVVLWCAAIACMQWQSVRVGLALGIVAGAAVLAIKKVKHRTLLDGHLAEYERLYGPHPGYDDRAQRYGAAMGAVMDGGFGGGYFVGSLIGVGLDHLRSKKRKLLMSTAQASAYETVRRLSAYRPVASFAVYLMWVLLGAGGVCFVGLLARGT